MKRLVTSFFFMYFALGAGSALAQKQGHLYIDSLQKELPKAKEDTSKADILYSIATGYYRLGEYSQSLQYNIRLQKLSEQIGDKENLSAALEGIGRNYHAIAENKAHQLPDSLNKLTIDMRLQRAHYYLVKAIDVQKETGNVDLLQEAYEHLSRVQLLQGDTAGSKESFRQYNNYLAGVYNKEKSNEAIKKDLKEVYTKKQDELKRDNEQKQLSLQKEMQLNALKYEYEKKQAEAKNEEERAQLQYEQEMRQKQIVYEYEKEQAKLLAEKEKSDAISALMIREARREKNYYLVGIGMLGLLSIGMLNRFTVLRRNRKVLEEKNRQIAAEKEKADMQRIRAENSERFKQQFLANMSHEIRTPMNAVGGMTELLLNKEPRADQLNYLQAISKSSDILLHIINDILDLSKIEAGKMELEAIDFSIGETLAQVKDTLSHRADDKGLQLVVTVDDDMADVVVGDPYRLNQILINLGGNAIKFTEKGSVQFIVKQLKKEGDTVAVSFAIVDTGIGIPEDKVGNLFQNFAQVNNSDTRKYGGTGLGLSISKQLVELQGGKIAVESKVGSGTTFSFILNYKVGSGEKLRQRMKHEKNADCSVLNGLRILVADDNEYNRMVVAETLQLKSDVVIGMAVNGAEAVRMVEEGDYDVVLMDVQMPVMNGIDATCHIRQKLKAPKNAIPVIALTASIMRADIEKCMECGMNNYVPKPFKSWQLINTIADTLGRKRIPVENTTSPTDEQMQYITVNDGTVTDAAYLKKFCEGNEERMRKYISIYLQAVPAFRERLSAAADAKDMKEIAQRIHAFKPNWMIMGMKRTGELGVKIEQQCAESNEKVYDNIKTLLEHTEQSLKELGINA